MKKEMFIIVDGGKVTTAMQVRLIREGDVFYVNRDEPHVAAYDAEVDSIDEEICRRTFFVEDINGHIYGEEAFAV